MSSLSKNNEDPTDQAPKTIWESVRGFIWDGLDYNTVDRKRIQKLDMFLMTWATYGYFIRILDTSNMGNAYVSGMKEDLNINGDEYNRFTTYWTVGYLVGQIPSQLVVTKVRPSIWLPCAELAWTIITFLFATVSKVEHIYGMRFLVGVCESPFYVGVISVLGSWYTPRELAKRTTIFYSASFVANMFSGYLQAAVYTGLDGVYGLPGWKWLFIICGVISLPGPVYGLWAIPDSPYNTRARYLNAEDIAFFKKRVVDIGRKPFEGVSVKNMKAMFKNWVVWIYIPVYIVFYCNTSPPAYFAIYLKSLKKYSIAQVNVIPTAGSACGLVVTLACGWISDGLGTRWTVAMFAAFISFLSCLILSVAPGEAGVLFGYIINPACLGFGPVSLAWINEICGSNAEERALIVGLAQTIGASFYAWVPLVIFNTGSMAPRFKMGYTVMTCLSVVQVLGMPLMRWFELRDKKAAALRGDDSGTGSTGDGSGAGSTGDVSKTGSTESVGEVFVTDLKV